ncbi:MAG: hypothetical protein JSW34_11400 [Candidatus Zixiibacteriota bacterium]|nr:MAG: hypothetical protein JSW34_11400 [candidate division Zixibacteria bacterium]
MSESTRKKIIAAVMVLVVIWGYNNLKPASDKPPRPKATPAAAVTATSDQGQPKVTTPRLVDVEEKAKEPWGTDPFRVKAKKQAKKPGSAVYWRLSGILYNSHSPSAIINKRHVKTGDVITGARVVKIDRKSVTLEYNGKQMILTVTKG